MKNDEQIFEMVKNTRDFVLFGVFLIVSIMIGLHEKCEYISLLFYGIAIISCLFQLYFLWKTPRFNKNDA